jgi:murein L,D-transpeptidase YcbB/YkuD
MTRFIGARAVSGGAVFVVFMLLASTLVHAQSEAPQTDSGQIQPFERERSAPADVGPQTARATFEAARRYAEIAASGGWPRVARSVGPDTKGKPIVELRRHLAAEDFLTREEADKPVWDARLEDALKRFQSHMGLEQTGRLSRETLREMNVTATERARQLQATAKRLSKLKFDFSRRYVAVNIPAAEVESAESGARVERYDAVVGGRKHPSPEIAAKIVSIDINPAWTVPSSIIKKELVPKLRHNPDYLAREHIRVFDARGHEIDPHKLRRVSKGRAARFTFRQDPGLKNSLGTIRISMPNKQEVYMHDTPEKQLFERDYRFLSHGCVRVKGVYDLAAWLLQDADEPRKWDQASLRNVADEGKSMKIRLRQRVPVIWVYMTGWAKADGATYFRRDIYNLDKGTKLGSAGRARQL